MTAPIKYVSDKAVLSLSGSVEKNLERYAGAGFSDLRDQPAWDISLNIDYDDELLGTLDQTSQQKISEIDLKNSTIVGQALRNLTPALANEEKIWVRLSHIEAFEYCHSRWLKDREGDDLAKNVRDHMFAPSQTAIRDDHALSRLWWNYHIAERCMPDDPERALRLILKTADIRSNFVERIWMTSRREIAGAILREMDSSDWITERESNFRDFMKAVNRYGGGVVFEALSEAETAAFVSRCAAKAAEGNAAVQ